MMGLTHELLPMQPPLISFNGCKGIVSLPPISPGLCWDGLCPPGSAFPADMGGDTRTPLAAAVLAKSFPPLLSPWVPQPAPFKTCSLSHISGSFSPCCDINWKRAVSSKHPSASSQAHLPWASGGLPDALASFSTTPWAPASCDSLLQTLLWVRDQPVGFACNSSLLHWLCRALNQSSE